MGLTWKGIRRPWGKSNYVQKEHVFQAILLIFAFFLQKLKRNNNTANKEVCLPKPVSAAEELSLAEVVGICHYGGATAAADSGAVTHFDVHLNGTLLFHRDLLFTIVS